MLQSFSTILRKVYNMITNEHIIYDTINNILIKCFHSNVDIGKRNFRVHYHTSCELSLIISGSGTYEVDNNKYNFASGDVFLFGSNEHHCITDVFSDLDLLNIYFEPRLLWESQESMELLALFFSRNSSFRNQFCDEPFLQDQIRKIEDEITYKRLCYRLEIRYSLFSALGYILRNYDYTSYKGNPSENYQSMTSAMKNAVAYIDENFSQNRLYFLNRICSLLSRLLS